MSENQHPNPDDLLERAISAVKNEQVPIAPSSRTVTDTLSALRRAEQPPTLFHRVIKMVQQHKVAASFFVTFSGVAIYLAVLLVGSVAPVSFAQVAEQLRSIHSMTCTLTAGMPNGSKPISIRESCMSPGKTRMEMPNGDLVIADSQAHISLMLDHKHKTAMVIKLSLAPAATSQPSLQNLDVVESFKNLAGDKSEPLDDRQIGDIKAKGFRVNKSGFNESIYVDPKTGLPIEMDIDMAHVMGMGDIVVNQFDFNANLDPALFSTDIPPGYRIQKTPVLQTNGDLVQYAVQVLQAYTQHKNGQFPPRLDDSAELIKTVMSPAKNGKIAPGEMKTWNSIFALSNRFADMKKGEDWDYLPEAAKLGDSGTLIFWYKDPKTQNYRAVYGDLRITDITADQLPKAEKQPEGL